MKTNKKLLSINNYHYVRGGSDAMYFSHAKLMEEHGFDSAFFSMHHKMNLATNWSKYFVNEIEFGEKYGVMDKIIKASKSIYSFEARKKLNKLLDDNNIDIAHMHCIYHHISPSINSIFKDRGIPLVMTAHDLKIACPAYKMLSKNKICEKCKGGDIFNVVKNRCIKNSSIASAVVYAENIVHSKLESYKNNVDKIVVPSKFFINKFVEWGWSKDIFEYVPNFIFHENYEPNYSPGNYFIYFGRLSEEKGVETLLRAASLAGIDLKIVGTGPDTDSLKKYASDINCNVEFLGYKSGNELHSLIKNSRCVVVPSEWYENAPMVILEAFALGKIVIGARIGGIPELIDDDGLGFLFDSGSHEGLYEKIVQVNMLSDNDLMSMGKFSRQNVIAKYSYSVYVESILKLYRNLSIKNEVN